MRTYTWSLAKPLPTSQAKNAGSILIAHIVARTVGGANVGGAPMAWSQTPLGVRPLVVKVLFI
jgi:hypothetical protein